MHTHTYTNHEQNYIKKNHQPSNKTKLLINQIFFISKEDQFSQAPFNTSVGVQICMLRPQAFKY